MRKKHITTYAEHEAKQAAYAARRRTVTDPQLAAYEEGVRERLAREAAAAVDAQARKVLYLGNSTENG